MIIQRLLSRSAHQSNPCSPALSDGWFEGPNGQQLYHSRFNPIWLSELGIDPSVIVDAGSYDGGDAFRFSSHFPHARVITIEGEPLRYQIVNDVLRDTSVEVINGAVSDRDGEANWFTATADGKVDAQGSLYRQTDRMNRKHPHVRQAEEPIRVQTIRLDTLSARLGADRIDLLHMDIQGGEYAALQGLGELRPAVIFLEVNDSGWIGGGTKSQIHDWLASREYQLAADLKGDRLYSRPQ